MMKNLRREFIKKASLLTLSGLAATRLLEAKPAKKIGLQLYSLREDIKDNVKGVLEEVAKIGYKTLEAANYQNGSIYGMTPMEFKNTVNGLGMEMRSAHVGGPNYTKEAHSEAIDWWKKASEDHANAGASYLIKPSMPIPKTLDELKVWCDYYNSVGEITRADGLMFGFHNHSREFEKIEGEIMFDFMLKNTDPKLFCMELDVYWCQEGGYNPVDYLKTYKGRFPLLHIKDEMEIGQSGKMDFKSIFKAAYAQGMTDYFVEVEKYNFTPIESVRKSFDYLASASYVKK
ncbi:sugar phosphate isomerase/epimerase family protein [Lunatibacter salilacus]|uniref:sugar phosphate isomerase/epimerase family protein n=1 Tax=Lunatibacter salilacus TaxID=2483804 RepID=UPI001F236DBD|nr:sugar phosphate isomerase/epimerase [Lunatibacter salilacus]